MRAVAKRDPDFNESERPLDTIRRLAERGDTDAQEIVADYDSPLNKAVDHIIAAALSGASDWPGDGPTYEPIEGGRTFSQVIEDFLDQSDFDPIALLPGDMKAGVDPMALMLALNRALRFNKALGD